MSTVTTKAVAKVAAVATGLAMATSMLALAPMAHAALTATQVSSILSLLTSFGADASTIANVQASLTGGTPSTPSTGGSMSSSCSFTMDLKMGSSGSQVTCLQQALIAAGYSIPAGATGYFGGQTQTAVIAWQKAAGITPAAGYFGAISRAKWGGSSTPAPGPGTPVTGNGLKVMLSATSPNGTVLVQGQGIGDLGDYTFSNPTSAPINVTSLTMNRIGVSNDSTLTNIYLYQGVMRLTDSVGISGGQFKFNNASGLFTVPAGGSITVSVRSDIAGSTSGQQIGVALIAVSSSGTLDSSVSFPVNSGYQTISAATLATVDYTTAAATPSAVTISPQNDFPIWQETVSVSSNPVKLTSLKFTNLGSIDASKVLNLRLYVDGTMVGSALTSLAADRSATFDLSAAPVMLSTQNHIVKILANIAGGANRTLQLSIQRSSDGMFIDSQLGQPVTPTAAASTFAAVSSGVITMNSVTSSTGVSVSLDPASPNQNVAVGATSVKWATFSMLASGEDVKVSDLYVFASSTTSGGALAGVGGLDNGKIFFNGVQVGSTKDIGSLTANAADFSLGSSLILPAGQTSKIDIYGDAKDTAGTNLPNNATVIVTLKAGSSNAQGQDSLTSTNVPAAATNSNTITVSSSSLTASKASGYGNQTVIAGANNAKLAQFKLSTGSTEGVTVNTIYITFPNAVASTITNLILKDDATGTMYGSTVTTPSTSNAFSSSLSIPVSSEKSFSLYGNILSGAESGTIVASVGASTAGTGNLTGVSASPSATGLQTITLGSGTLSLAAGAGDPVSNNVLAGAAAVSVGQFTFSSTNSSYTVQNLAVLIPNGAITSVANVMVSYKDVNGATQTGTGVIDLPSTTEAYATATFTGLTMYVPMNDSANIDVSVGTPTIASGAISGAAIVATLDDGNGTNLFRAVNSAGSSLTKFNGNNTNISSGGTFYVRKSIPTLSNLGSQTFATGVPMYKFTIKADSSGPIEWTRLTFNVATSSATITSVYLTDNATGNNLLDNTSTSASTTGTTITIDLTQNATQTKYQQVAAGETKTYALYGTVSHYSTYSTTLSLATDSSASSTAAASAHNGAVTPSNVTWSDRSATSHSITSSDWINGYLLKNWTSTAVTYSN